MQVALALEIETGATVRDPLDHLEAVDLPLDGAGAPKLDDGGAHGWLVLPEPGDEAAEIGRGCSFQLGRQSGGIVLAQVVGEGAYIGVVHGAVRHASDLGLVPLDDAAQGLGSVDEQCQRSATGVAVGAPVRAASAQGPERSRLTTVTLGWAVSQSRTGADERPGNRSMTCRSSKSHTMVP